MKKCLFVLIVLKTNGFEHIILFLAVFLHGGSVTSQPISVRIRKLNILNSIWILVGRCNQYLHYFSMNIFLFSVHITYNFDEY